MEGGEKGEDLFQNPFLIHWFLPIAIACREGWVVTSIVVLGGKEERGKKAPNGGAALRVGYLKSRGMGSRPPPGSS